MWDRERKGTLDEDASSPARETAQDADEHSKKKTHTIYPGIMTKLTALDSFEEQ